MAVLSHFFIDLSQQPPLSGRRHASGQAQSRHGGFRTSRQEGLTVQYDLIIKNGLIVTPEATIEAAVLVKDGEIAGIVAGNALPSARLVYDATGKHVLPGIIDGHVHFRDPGLTYKEDFGTGSLAAAYGGVCTVIDMPNVVPPTSNVAGFRAKLAEAGKKSYVDFGIIGVVLEESIPDLVPMRDAGVIGYKIFMGETVGKLPSPSDGGILDAMRVIAATGLRVGVHAEDNSIIKYLTEQLKAAGRTDPMAFVESRPSIAEKECISRAIMFAQETGAKLHIYHMSSKEGVDLVADARCRGLDVTAETCPHYLLLDCTFMDKVGSMLKIGPPVRAKEDQKRLWEGLMEGVIQLIATDHSPHTREEKINSSIWDAIPGFCGVESAVSLMLDQVNKGRLTLNHYVNLASEGPARTWNMYPRKGCIAIGADADFTVVDMEKKGVVKADELHSKNKVTPFDGFEVKGMPVATIVRGRIVMRDGKVKGAPAGRLVTPVK
jgi:dihydroorotase